MIYVRLVGTSSPRRPAGLMRGWLCAGHFRVLTLRRIVRAVGGLGIVSDLGFYGSQPSRTFSEKRPCRTIREIRGGNVSSFWISSGRHFRRFRLFRGRSLLHYTGLVKRGWKRSSTCLARWVAVFLCIAGLNLIWIGCMLCGHKFLIPSS